MKLCGLFLFSLLSGAFAAQAQVLSSKEDVARSRLSVTLEMTKFSLGEQDLESQGIQLQYDYAFSNSLFLEGFVSTAMNSGDGGLQSSFVGFGGYALYSFFGSCCEVRKTVSLDSKPLFSEEVPQHWLLLVGPGIDQYLLNGTKGVYSSSGLGIQASLVFPVFSQTARVNFKMSQLTAGALSIPATFAGFGLVFSF